MRVASLVLLAALASSALAPGSARASDAAPRERWVRRHAPTRGMVEMGLFLGAFVPRDHELYDPARVYEPLRRAGAALGLRFGYYPLSFLGVEVEGAMAPMRTATTRSPATIAAGRAHVLLQLPYRVAPFVVLGYGALAQAGPALGSDVDPAFHYGGGVKLFLRPLVALRLDVRADVTGQHALSGGLTQHLEVLLGVAVTPGRRAPGGGR